jgi:hypothetical protein
MTALPTAAGVRSSVRTCRTLGPFAELSHDPFSKDPLTRPELVVGVIAAAR